MKMCLFHAVNPRVNHSDVYLLKHCFWPNAILSTLQVVGPILAAALECLLHFGIVSISM